MPLMILGVNLLGYITSSITNIVQVSSQGSIEPGCLRCVYSSVATHCQGFGLGR